MKLSNRRLIEDIQTLSALTQKQLPVKISYAIAKNIGKIQSELNIYNKERAKLVDKYAEKDEKGEIVVEKNKQIKFKDKCVEDWKRDINALLDIESDIDIHKFSINDLNGFNISAAEIKAIDYMIKE